MYAVTVNLTSK